MGLAPAFSRSEFLFLWSFFLIREREMWSNSVLLTGLLSLSFSWTSSISWIGSSWPPALPLMSVFALSLILIGPSSSYNSISDSNIIPSFSSISIYLSLSSDSTWSSLNSTVRTRAFLISSLSYKTLSSLFSTLISWLPLTWGAGGGSVELFS